MGPLPSPNVAHPSAMAPEKKQDICMNTTNLEKFPRLQHHECSKNSTSNLKANFNVV